MAAHVLALTVDLHLPSSRSLKDKRSVIKAITDGARRRYAVAVAETDHHDLRQRAELCFVGVGAESTHVGQVLDEVERFVWSFTEVEVAGHARDWLEVDR